MENLKSIYKSASQLLKNDNDSIKEPYKSKYAAKELFEEMKKILSDTLDKRPDDNLIQGQLVAVYTQLGTISIDTDEFSAGQDNFERAIEISAAVQSTYLVIYSAILCRNSLAVLWALRDEQEKALSYLEEAKGLYSKYKNEETSRTPKSLDEYFDSETVTNEVECDAFEKLHTLTLYYLAQVMEKLGRQAEAAEYCMSTLQRQLSSNDYVGLTWAINAATLAQFFESKFKFRIARRLLAVSWAMMQSVDNEEASNTSTSNEEYSKSVGIICKRWGTYCVSLLQDSFNSLEETKTDENSNESEVTYLEQVNFSKIQYTEYEESVSCMLAKTVNDATEIFKFGLRWLNDSLKYFTLLEHASTNAEITQQMSTLYKLLAEFDPAPDRQSKMHKRRVVLLSDVVTELNPQYYLNICHQLNYEIAEAYSAMVDCKYAVVENKTPTGEQTIKINTLVSHGINSFGKVLDSFNCDENGVKIISEGYVRPALIAYFRIGRLWSKKIATNNKKDKVGYLKQSVENYKKIINYCQSHPEGASCVEEELKICKEMVELLPLKIQRMLQE